jgi:gas vesicle structural protein
MAMNYDNRAPAGRSQQALTPRGGVQKMGGASGLAEVLAVILEKGIVIDAWVRLSIIGIEILTIDARIVVASVDTYLRFAEAVNRLDLTETGGAGITELRGDGAKKEVKGALEGAGESAKEGAEKVKEKVKGGRD